MKFFKTIPDFLTEVSASIVRNLKGATKKALRKIKPIQGNFFISRKISGLRDLLYIYLFLS